MVPDSIKTIVAGTAAIALIAAGPVAITSAQNNNSDKVTICHRTNSATNPYVKITVAAAAVDGDTGNNRGQGDHFAEHKGPLASSQAVAQDLKDSKTKWGDIIPPVAGHSGLNWTSAGQAMLNNDCKFVTQAGNGGNGGQNGGNGDGQVLRGVTGGRGAQVTEPRGAIGAGAGGADAYSLNSVQRTW